MPTGGDTLEDLRFHMLHDHDNLLENKRIVLIHAGTNDLFTLNTIEEMMEDLTALVDTIREKMETTIYCIAFSAILPRPKRVLDDPSKNQTVQCSSEGS